MLAVMQPVVYALANAKAAKMQHEAVSWRLEGRNRRKLVVTSADTTLMQAAERGGAELVAAPRQNRAFRFTRSCNLGA